jgi:hypothetical protein
MGSSGVNDYWIEFDEDCPSNPSTQTHQDVHVVNGMENGQPKAELRWGDSRSFSLTPQATYNVIFDAFDGRHLEFSSPGGTYIVVASDTAQVRLSTVDPATFSWP